MLLIKSIRGMLESLLAREDGVPQQLKSTASSLEPQTYSLQQSPSISRDSGTTGTEDYPPTPTLSV